MQEMWVQSLDQKDNLYKETAIHSSVIAWKIPWTEELRGLQSIGSQKVGQDLGLNNNNNNHDLAGSSCIQWVLPAQYLPILPFTLDNCTQSLETSPGSLSGSHAWILHFGVQNIWLAVSNRFYNLIKKISCETSLYCTIEIDMFVKVGFASFSF